MSEGEVDGFDIDLQPHQITDVFVISGRGGGHGDRPHFALQLRADGKKLGGDGVIVCFYGLFQVGDRLAGLFLFKESCVVGIGGQA